MNGTYCNEKIVRFFWFIKSWPRTKLACISKAPYPNTVPTRAPSLIKGFISASKPFLVWAGEQIKITSASETISLAFDDTFSIFPTISPLFSQEELFVYPVILFYHNSGLLVRTLML